MPRRLILLAFLLGIVALHPWGDAVAQEPAATPETAPLASPRSAARPTAPALAEFVRGIPLGTEAASAASGVAVDANGTLYVIDALKDQIRVFDRDGHPVATWGTRGSGPGQFKFETNGDTGNFWGDLAIGPDGNLYVLDAFNGRVQVLAPDGTFIREWSQAQPQDRAFAKPTGLTIDTAGHVYVTDRLHPQLQIFDANGQLLATWQPAHADGGPFQYPSDVAVDADGSVWVTDADTSRIYHFAPDGTVIAAFGKQGGEPGQFLTPWGLAVDAAGNLYVAEYAGSRVQVFGPDGTPRGTIGSYGQPGQLSTPIYLTIGADGLLYVADENKNRILVFRLLPPLLAATGTPIPG